MMRAVRGIYRDGVVELLESPEVSGDAEVVVTFLREAVFADSDEPTTKPATPEPHQPLEDFEPIVPMKPIFLSDLVLEDRG